MTHQDKVEMDKKAYGYLKDCRLILDIGCGRGRFISFDSTRIKGVDINKESVAYCVSRSYDVLKGTATNLPYPENYFDGIHCSHLIEHLGADDAWKLLSEIDRVLEVNGIVCIRTPFNHEGFYQDIGHVKPYLPSAITSCLCDNVDRILQLQYPRIKGHYEQVGFDKRADGCAYMVVLKKVKRLG